jgi:1,4-dihydroxy-2-naphthoate octaprenyltransferase
MIFFGLVGVLGTLYLYKGTIEIAHLLPALSTGFFATAVLNINNIRDIESDRQAGKRSIPVRLGRKKAIWYHWFLLSAGFISAILYTLLNYHSFLQLIFLITLPLFIINGRDVYLKTKSLQLDPSLRKMAITSLLFSLIFGAGLVF